jgi:putative ABC transport system permease protein
MGFRSHHIAGMVFGESLFITMTGCSLGILLTFPVARKFGEMMGTFLPVFNVEPATIYLDIAFSLLVGIIAALFPAWRANTIRIADGLRRIG